MKKSTAASIEAITFNTKFTAIEAEAKIVRDELKKNISFLKKLSKDARALYKYADAKCYEDVQTAAPIDGIKGDLNAKMDYLNWLMDAAIDLQDVIGNLRF